MWIVVNLFPWPSLALPTNNSGHTDRDGMNACTHGLDNMEFCSPRLTWLYLLSVRSASTRDQHWVPVWHHFLRWSTSNLVKGWPYWSTSIVGHFSLGRDSCVGMGLPFLHIILLPKLIFTEAHRWCAHHPGTPHSIASNQGTVFIAREVQQCDHTHRLNSHWVQCLQDADSHYWYYCSVSVL